MAKSLTNKLHLKQRLYSHRMAEAMSIEDHLTMFKDIIVDLEVMEVKYDEGDLGLILLCSLPSSYATFRDTILYSCDTLTLDEVFDALFSKEKMKQLVSGYEAQGEGLFVHGRPQEQGFGNPQRAGSKFRNAEKTCNYCKQKGHIKTNCYKLKNKKKRMVSKQGKPQKNMVKLALWTQVTLMENYWLLLMVT